MKKIQIWNWSASILTLIWFSLAAHLYHTFTEQEKVVRGESARLANALQMQISRILESVDIALLSVAQRIADQPRTPGEIQTLLLNERKSLPPYFSLAFIDAQGIGVAASEPGFKPGASYADRDYFVAHRVSGQKLFVGGPLRGRTLGKQFFATSRRVETIDGQWIGVLMGSIEPYLMAEIFAEFPQGTNGSIELANTRTKQIVARHPNHEKHFAQDISKSALFSGVLDRPSGTYEVPTTTDGIARVIAYHQTPKAPFVSLVSYARQDLRNEFFNMAIAYTAIGLLFSLIIIAFARLFQRNQVERERQFVVESELTLARQSQARMEIERTAQMERFFAVSPDLICIADSSGRLIKVNRAWEALLGLASSSIEGRFAGDFMHPDDALKLPIGLARMVASHQVNRSRNRIRTKTGEYRLFEWSAIIHDELVYAAARDITDGEAAAETLRRSEARFRGYFDLPVIGVAVTSLEKGWQEVNPRLCEIFGYSAAELRLMTWTDITHPEDLAGDVAEFNRILSGESDGYTLEKRFIRKNGQVIHAFIAVRCVRDTEHKIDYFVALVQDITDRKIAEEDLRIAAVAFESQEAMVVTDAEGLILRVNQSFCETTGYSFEELVGKNPHILKSGRHDEEFYRAMWTSLKTTGAWKGEIWDRRKDGSIYPKWATITAVRDARGHITHFIGTHSDITERKRAEEKINALAFYDHLTGLPNRTLLIDRVGQAQATGARNSFFGALLFIDLDNFKTLNDTEGHEKGDHLLREAAQRLQASIREEDTAARQGGNEFVILLPNQGKNAQDAAAASEVVALKVLNALGEVYDLGGIVYRCSASIGVTVFCGNDVSTEDLMRQADLAMYRAKSSGRNAVCYFDPEMEIAVRVRAELEHDMRNGIAQGDFLLHYQPQVGTDGVCFGVEALIRWRHPQRGMVSPAQFIPLAEESGLILPLGRWVIEAACCQLKVWARSPVTANLTVAVNVSARQFHQLGFADEVMCLVKSTGANPARLKLDLTESLLARDIEGIIATMHRLKEFGIGFSLDDFGTGYSSLNYLKRLPLDQLKIDQSFVRDVLTDPNDAAIARTVVALGQSLGMAVIAEGVETADQKAFLEINGCYAYQGYYFSRPLPSDQLELLLNDRSALP